MVARALLLAGGLGLIALAISRTRGTTPSAPSAPLTREEARELHRVATSSPDLVPFGHPSTDPRFPHRGGQAGVLGADYNPNLDPRFNSRANHDFNPVLDARTAGKLATEQFERERAHGGAGVAVGTGFALEAALIATRPATAGATFAVELVPSAGSSADDARLKLRAEREAARLDLPVGAILAARNCHRPGAHQACGFVDERARQLEEFGRTREQFQDLQRATRGHAGGRGL